MSSRSGVLAFVALSAMTLAAIVGGLAVTSGTTPGSLPSSGDSITTPTPASTTTPEARANATDVCTTSFDFTEREEQVFDPYYTQQREVAGLTIVAGPNVSPSAIDAAQVTILQVFANNDHEEILSEQGAYVIVADPNEGVLDLPEFACLEDELGTNFFTHVCGIADRADYPVVTVNELDLLGDRRGPCNGVNILYHELGHMVHNFAADPPDHLESRYLYSDAMSAGLYENAYAATNYREYFAEGTQAYFDAQDREGERNRSWLEDYDPALYELLRRVYGD